jgi:hypothetical protein
LKVRRNSEALYETDTTGCNVGWVPDAGVWSTAIVLFQELSPNAGYELHVGSERKTIE